MNFYALNEVPVNGWDRLYVDSAVGMSMDVSASIAFARFGAAAAQMQVQAGASGTRRVLGQATAAMSLDAEAKGIRRALGYASSASELQVFAEGRTAKAQGSSITMLLQVLASGRLPTVRRANSAPAMALDVLPKAHTKTPIFGGSDVQVWVHTIADGRLPYTVNGSEIAMRLGVEARGRSSNRLQGEAIMQMGLEIVRILPRQYRLTRSAAFLDMEFGAKLRMPRITTLPAQYSSAPKLRTIMMAAESREIRVPKQARTTEAAEA